MIETFGQKSFVKISLEDHGAGVISQIIFSNSFGRHFACIQTREK